ncbi:DUF3575 domain-containing protein [Barnesiella sp. WM24]|uniref:DUF3575 domain-containing protein n=1 Tax=Barnesiella sp. WM24 TaxID=2558278 RepID=UPI000ACE77BC|nr:DUF3575 domain-containing protein [Barnesiella sp. WM24]MDE6113849.1 DUF3575 domain-containing protein [Muribaculum sp.]TFU94816.1 DUF3575 domain-containing protein [Barnesiella sp. WM24]
MKRVVYLMLAFALSAHFTIEAQKVAVKTNLLYDALLNVNAGVEVGLAPRWTVDVSADYNSWTLSHDRKWKHWFLQPEARYWFCERFSGHFVGAHLVGGQYNVGGLKNGIKFLGTDFSLLSDRRYQGWFAGAGVAYGYSWIIDRHWNFEAEIGFGWTYSRSDVYPCATCGTKLAEGKAHNYVGPTKAALNLIYTF